MVVRIYLDRLFYSPLEFTQYRRQLRLKGYQIVDRPQVADLIASSYLSTLKKYLKFNKKYLLWSHEPYHNWSAQPLLRLPIPASVGNYHKQITKKNIQLAKVHIMNAYTEDVFTHNLRYFYFTEKLELRNQNNLNRLTSSKKSPICALSTKYPVSYYQDNPFTLLPERYQIIHEGHRRQILDIHGQNWGNMAIGESRRDSDRRVSKRGILKGYRYNLCLESACAPYYITEKLWESIQSYCLPIYYSNSTIYQLFPKQSFIDYRDFQTPAALFDYLARLTPEQYVARLNRCIKVFNQLVQKRLVDALPTGDSGNRNINYLDYRAAYQHLERKLEKLFPKQKKHPPVRSILRSNKTKNTNRTNRVKTIRPRLPSKKVRFKMDYDRIRSRINRRPENRIAATRQVVVSHHPKTRAKTNIINNVKPKTKLPRTNKNTRTIRTSRITTQKKQRNKWSCRGSVCVKNSKKDFTIATPITTTTTKERRVHHYRPRVFRNKKK